MQFSSWMLHLHPDFLNYRFKIGFLGTHQRYFTYPTTHTPLYLGVSRDPEQGHSFCAAPRKRILFHTHSNSRSVLAAKKATGRSPSSSDSAE